MKKLTQFSLILALVACISAPVCSVSASAATPTGYTKAEDVDYKISGGYRVNWGVRDEECTFLSTYAQSFYTGNYQYSILSEVDGGSSQSNAPQSDLYKELHTLMKSKHTKITGYQETRPMYQYTDCEGNDTSSISSFYSKKAIGPTWDSGATWNREHTWPNSKGLNGGDENDIMMLRPTASSENSSRGNKAYGESSGYYNPGESVRGDCARIVLYTYVRWENTSYMWGSSGVIENLNVLLSWMEEDPVDTWEMGRNDAVQYITGTRNVFVDYPEYAWLLFGKDLPQSMTTPSKNAANTPVTPDVDSSKPDVDSSTATEEECAHDYNDWYVTQEPTESMDGLKIRKCKLCGKIDYCDVPKTGSDKENATGILANCNATVVSPVAITMLLAGAYVFLRKK